MSHEPSDKWFVSLLYETEDEEPLPEINHPVGIDLGIKDFLVMSDGTKVSNLNAYRNLEAGLIKEQRILSRR